MSYRRTRKPVGRPPRSRSRKGAAQPMNAAAAARQYAGYPFKLLAWVAFNENAPTRERITAAKRLLDLGHGKPRPSKEMLEPIPLEEVHPTLEELQDELKRGGLDHLINLIPNDDKKPVDQRQGVRNAQPRPRR